MIRSLNTERVNILNNLIHFYNNSQLAVLVYAYLIAKISVLRISASLTDIYYKVFKVILLILNWY